MITENETTATTRNLTRVRDKKVYLGRVRQGRTREGRSPWVSMASRWARHSGGGATARPGDEVSRVAEAVSVSERRWLAWPWYPVGGGGTCRGQQQDRPGARRSSCFVHRDRGANAMRRNECSSTSAPS